VEVRGIWPSACSPHGRDSSGRSELLFGRWVLGVLAAAPCSHRRSCVMGGWQGQWDMFTCW